MSDPLPPARPVRRRCSAAASRRRAAVTTRSRAAQPSTDAVCAPTSGELRDQSNQACPTSSRCSSSVPPSRAAVSAASRIGIAIDVSSVHSPGAQWNGPPPFMSTGISAPKADPNS